MKFKRLIPALAMLLVSAILLGTSTFAWFSMNTTVQAANMQVKAVAEQGILINEIATADDSHWDNEATTSQTEGILLHATSTANTGTWYVAHSTLQNDAAAATSGAASLNLADGYKTLGSGDYTTATTTVAAEEGVNALQTITYVDTGTSGYSNGEGYYVKYTYYLKSSADAITTSVTSGGQNLKVAVNATGNTGTSANIDKALRAAVVIGGKAYIFAPLADSNTVQYYVNAASSATTAYKTAQNTAANIQIPATTSNGMAVDIYLYFEGEDTNLKTSNVLSALDNLTVTVDFTLETLSANATDNGVSLS